MESVGTAGVILYGNLVVLEVVYVHGDDFAVPYHLVIVELRDVEFLFCSVEIVRVVAVFGVVAFVLPVVGAVDDILAVYCLDDVDFATGRPTDCIDVFAEHPEGGPDSLARGERDAGFDGTVGKAELALSNHAGRCVFCSLVVFLVCADVEDAVLHVGVLAAAGIVLPLVVAPAASARADLEGPLGGVNGVELVVPEVHFGRLSDLGIA